MSESQMSFQGSQASVHQMSVDELDQQLVNDLQPDQDIQPEENAHRDAGETETSRRGDIGKERVERNAGDDVTEAPEEA